MISYFNKRIQEKTALLSIKILLGFAMFALTLFMGFDLTNSDTFAENISGSSEIVIDESGESLGEGEGSVGSNEPGRDIVVLREPPRLRNFFPHYPGLNLINRSINQRVLEATEESFRAWSMMDSTRDSFKHIDFNELLFRLRSDRLISDLLTGYPWFLQDQEQIDEFGDLVCSGKRTDKSYVFNSFRDFIRMKFPD